MYPCDDPAVVSVPRSASFDQDTKTHLLEQRRKGWDRAECVLEVVDVKLRGGGLPCIVQRDLFELGVVLK